MLRPSWLEVNFFLLLLAVSLWALWLRLGPIVKTVLDARPDPGFRLRPLGPRLGRFFWNVMLQGKVIRERPLAGLAHAFVFWGFCCFALVTIDHLGAGVGIDVVVSDSPFGRVYFTVAALFAVAVAASILYLTVRRFVFRPWFLGDVSLESGLIAFLIVVLMITYLISYFGLVEDGTAEGRLNWWVHTLALLVFLPVIPSTKHLHLVLSPLTVLMKRDGFSQIPPLAGDEDFGLESGKDITRIDALQAYTCVECGRCTEHCPATNTGKALNPKEVILSLRDYLNEYGVEGEQPILGTAHSMEAAFQCTTCGACEYQCPVGIQHLPLIIGLRRGAANTGKWADEHGSKLFLNLERHGNAMGFSPAEREKFIQKNAIPYFDGTQEYCLWLGCMGSYDPAGREIVLSLIQVMQHLGITFGVLRKERCSGDPARRLGNDLAFQQLVEANLEQIQAAKVRKMVSICPHCVRTIGTDWGEFGASIEIEHHSELLARHRHKLTHGKRHTGDRIVFHDPCYLGRYRNVFDEPRDVAALGGRVIDPPRARRHSFCCGAGGGLAFLGEEKGKRIGVERAEELAATGATVVGAACPFCHSMFRDALASISPAPPKLLDIAQIAAAGLKRE